MGRPAPMHLSEDERIHVQVFVRRGKANARTLTRARVLLKSDEGCTAAIIVAIVLIFVLYRVRCARRALTQDQTSQSRTPE